MIIYNSLSRKKEPFVPLAQDKVTMYACGITPYKPSHLGHAMQAIIFDIIRRYFEYKGYSVIYVRNYTDVDDKIINAARELNKDPLEHSKEIMEQTEKELAALRVTPADITPLVSTHIDEIIAFIELLLRKKYAYATAEGNVYFPVKRFKEYGKLSGQKVEYLRQWVRKDVEQDKKNPADFALWKTAKEGEIHWKSPWGNGRPGWHIECSAMSNTHLGIHFDIHGGGHDLIFPHHENELAQSESVHGGHFANYWVHNGLLMVGKEKMSKSLKNDVSIADWLKEYHPEVIRYLIITNHYRSHVQFNEKRYREANQKVYQIYKVLKRFHANKRQHYDIQEYEKQIQKFETYMDDDFNTPKVIAHIHQQLAKIQSAEDTDSEKRTLSCIMFIRQIGKVIGLFDLPAERVLTQMENMELKKIGITRSEIVSILKEREIQRKQGKYDQADAIRKELLNKRINILDSPDGTEWEILW